jgi:hypothetical protein
MVPRFVGATFSAGSSTSTTELRRDRVGVLAARQDRPCSWAAPGSLETLEVMWRWSLPATNEP